MKMLIVLFAIISAPLAHADDFFDDACVSSDAPAFEPAALYVVTEAGRGTFMGLTCQDLRGITQGANMIGWALYPAQVAITLSGELGLLLRPLTTNPAVLGVTVIGATGVSVVYLILKKTLNECEEVGREQLEAKILREVELRYGVSGRGVPLKIIKEEPRPPQHHVDQIIVI